MSEGRQRVAPRAFSELDLSRIWKRGNLAPEMRTTDGRSLRVIYPGVWTHADGPDFRDALIELDGRLTRGSVELHLMAGDWRRHGHQENAAYDEVALHVVLDDDLGEPVQQPPGRELPTLELRRYLTADDLAVAQGVARPLGSLGTTACLPTLAGGREDLVRAALRREGWKRLVAKQLRFAQEFQQLTPADVLLRGLLDALGYSRNRDGMAVVGERLRAVDIERDGPRLAERARALLLGAAGFLPLSDSEAELIGTTPDAAGEMLAEFHRLAGSFDFRPAPPSIWDLGRVRPQNHPARRLSSLGSLIALAAPEGILARALDFTWRGTDPWQDWLSAADPPIGAQRARQISTNVLAPFVAAYASESGDHALAEAVFEIWERVPGRADDAIAKQTLRQIAGERRFIIRLATEEQGLHQIGRFGCRQLRCFECPIAELALAHEASTV